MRTLVAAVCLVAGPVARPHPSAAAQDRAADWNTWLAGEASGFSGVVLIGRDDRIDVAAAFGASDQTGRPNLPDTRFNLGSINKTFTAIGIAQLIEQGRLGLDDRLITHVPDYPDKDAANRISIRQLLTHRSGVAQFMRADFGDVTVAAMTRIVGNEPLAFEPGTRQMYSNGGYVVLGRVIEVISGRSYAEYVDEHIYRAAGMTASGFVRSGDRADNIALPVATSATGTGPGAPPAPRAGNPAGGGYSAAIDLFRFARALRAGRLLGPKMTRFVLDGTFAEDPQWGFSLREQMAGSHRFIGNGGGAPGVNAEFRFEPAGTYTIVVLSNSSPPSATDLLKAILNRIAGGMSAGGAASATPAPSRQAEGFIRVDLGAESGGFQDPSPDNCGVETVSSRTVKRENGREDSTRRKKNMAVKPVPEGYHTVTPYLIVKDCDRLLTFLKAAFNAQVKEEHRLADGSVMHADVLVGDSHIMMGQANEKWPLMTGSILLYVPDADATYQAALRAGATSIQEMATQFYGDRSGGVKDPTGNSWWISTHVEDVSPEEMERRMKAMQPA